MERLSLDELCLKMIFIEVLKLRLCELAGFAVTLVRMRRFSPMESFARVAPASVYRRSAT
jgi:hypothetical protein